MMALRRDSVIIDDRSMDALHHAKPFIIVIDAGHGEGRAHNRGGVCYNEGDNNYYYSLVLKRQLERLPGVIVKLTRNKISDNPSFDYRGRVATGADLLLSVHSDAFHKASVRGTTVFDSVRRPNRRLATVLANAISTNFNHPNRGVKIKEGRPGWDWYAILRNSKAKSSMILEHGFHTNRFDCEHFKSHHKQLAKVTTDAIRTYYGLGGRVPSRPPAVKAPGNVIFYSQHTNNRGDGVRLLQKNLNKVLNTSISVDSSFGPETRKAVLRFQYKYGLERDGIAGQETLKALNREIGKDKTPRANLRVDGYWGKGTTTALQKALKTPVDGYISGQYKNSTTNRIFSTTHHNRKGSSLVRALQRKVGVKVDGYIGPNTIRGLQRYLGTIQDGVISRPSYMVKELQRRLNLGTF